MNNQKKTHSKSYLCYKNTEKYSCFLIFCVNFARDIHLLEVQMASGWVLTLWKWAFT